MNVVTKAIAYDEQLLEAEHQKNETIIAEIKARISADNSDNIKKPIPLVKQLQAVR